MTDEILPILAPNWLESLEKLREKRLQRRLGHEAGAGAACLNCGDKCPGLDLHFWRKICKNCKCGKDSHNVEDDDTCGWVQFQLLGTKPVKSNGIKLPGKISEMNLEWTPPGATDIVERYLDEMPADLVPVSGSDAARKRQQRLQTQIPAHDVDATLCDSLTPAEMKQMDEYVTHVRQYCVGQGKVIQLPIHLAQRHEINQPFARIVLGQTETQIANSETLPHVESELSNNLSNLSLRNKTNKQLPDNFDYNVDPNLGQNAGSIAASVEGACHECSGILSGGAVAISITRTDAQWHPHCFRCHHCHEPLADLLYFYDKASGHIYCGRDYATVRGIPRCAACDELIFLREYCLAENNAFHVKHFCCWECDIPLAGQQYIMDGQKPMCLPCFEEVSAARCADCGTIIGPDQQGAHLEGLHWHTPQCFVCKQCRKSLLGRKILFRNNVVYCSGACVALASTT